VIGDRVILNSSCECDPSLLQDIIQKSFLSSVSHSSPPATCSHTFWCLDDHLSLFPFLSNFTYFFIPMASQSRQNKGNRKPGPDPPANRYALARISSSPLPLIYLSPRRPPAWGQGARSSPTFSPGPARQQQQQQQQPPSTPATPMTFPPLSQTNGARSDIPRDRVLQALAALTVRRASSFSSFRRFLIYATGFNYHTSYKIRPALRGTPRFHHHRG